MVYGQLVFRLIRNWQEKLPTNVIGAGDVRLYNLVLVTVNIMADILQTVQLVIYVCSHSVFRRRGIDCKSLTKSSSVVPRSISELH